MTLFALPHASKPSQADWLNERSSTPPVSVINAAVGRLVLPPASDDAAFDPSALLLSVVLLPHAPSNSTLAIATAPKPNNFAFFIIEKPPIK